MENADTLTSGSNNQIIPQTTIQEFLYKLKMGGNREHVSYESQLFYDYLRW